MNHTKYSNGIKTIAMFLQMVFLVILIVMVTLLVNLFGRSMLSVNDIGSHSFFDSTYYAGILEQEAGELPAYLRMQVGNHSQEKDMDRYKQLKIQYSYGQTNLRYWFFCGDTVCSNVDEQMSREEALKQAKELGSYLYYDDKTIQFEGNIRQLGQEFQRNLLRLFRMTDKDGGLILAVDTQLAYPDSIAAACRAYETWVPWTQAAGILAILAGAAFVLTLTYLTLATGRHPGEDTIRLHRIDYIPTEILFVAGIVYVIALFAFCIYTDHVGFDISGTLILTGTLVVVSDAYLLLIYLSFVRRIKADSLISCSLTSFVIRTFKEGMRRQQITWRAAILYLALAGGGLFLAWGVFSKKSIWAGIVLAVLIPWFGAKTLRQALQRRNLLEGIQKIGSGDLNYKLEEAQFDGDYRELAENINRIGSGLSCATEENIKNERLKTELITNVSHDIKTPLTSIINYVNLIKMEHVQNEKVQNYLDILEKKSMRLKQLTEDLLEVSKINSGSIQLDMHQIDLVELICQTGGEFNEIFENRGLTVVTRLPGERVMILADGSRLWRVVQNLYNNVAKYALKDTRVYVELKVLEGMAIFTIKDISAQKIDKTAGDLGQRFVRGDDARSGVEGSGLGLSIAESLTSMMGGTCQIALDGDLFTASITFPVINP